VKNLNEIRRLDFEKFYLDFKALYIGNYKGYENRHPGEKLRLAIVFLLTKF